MIYRKLHRLLALHIACLILLSILITSPLVIADGGDAELHDVEVTASPSSQGIGGIIIVDAAVHFYGGCCYHLFANEVTANLSAPEGLDIIDGPTPEKYEEVDAQPGGTATVIHFKWSVQANSQGNFNLGVLVNTKNCGSVESEVEVEIVQGCVISYPDVYPKQLRIDKEIIISTTASTSLEGRSVESVSLFYVLGEELAKGAPENDSLFLDSGKEKSGNVIAMEQDPYIPNQWTCRFNITSTGSLNFWFVAEDNTGENTTSSLYTMNIIDQNAIDSVTGTIFWGLIISTVIGFILIFWIRESMTHKREKKTSVLNLDIGDGGEEKRGSVRDIVIIGILILLLVILALSLVTGLITDIVNLALG